MNRQQLVCLLNVNLGYYGTWTGLLDELYCGGDARVDGHPFECGQEVVYDLELAWHLIGPKAQWRYNICQEDQPHKGSDHPFGSTALPPQRLGWLVLSCCYISPI